MDILYKQLLELNKGYVPTTELISCLEEIKELSGRIGDCREKIKNLNDGESSLVYIQKVLSEKEKLEAERRGCYTLRDRLYKKLYRMGYVVRDIKKEML